MKAKWSHRADADLFEIGCYIATDNAVASERWVERLLARGDVAAGVPRAGRVVPEVENERDDIREVFVRNYRIVYRVIRTGIFVLTVIEGHKQLPADLDLDVLEP